MQMTIQIELYTQLLMCFAYYIIPWKNIINWIVDDGEEVSE